MYNLLKAEFYKLWRQKSFWCILFLIFLVGSVMMLDRGMPTSAFNCFLSFLYNIPILYFFVIVFCVSYIGESFETRTIHTCISEGHNRITILSAKMISYLTACIILLLFPLFIAFLTGLAIFGINAPFLPSIFLETVILFLAVIAMCMIPFLTAFLFMDLGKALTVPIVIFFIFLFLLNSNQAEFYSFILPMGQIRCLSLNLGMNLSLKLVVIDVLWILFCCLSAATAFYRKDLK